MQALAESGSVSFLTPVGYQSGSCGYCKDLTTRRRTENSSASYYAYARSLSVDHYQELVDRGWRRSGTILYKPDLRRQCCTHYTIRIPVAEFHPSRDQRQATNRWNRFVLGEDYIKEAAKLYPKTKDEKAQQRNGFDLVKAVHESEYVQVKKPPEPAHRFDVTLEQDTFTEEKYQLFYNYQQHVHQETPEEISRKGFKRFLCNSPLQRTTREVNGVEQKLGSFHQCYRLDGRLIAISVLDLLPHCVSGVYFIYHSDFERWGFGKISALREAALAREFEYRYYYMGYYIHSCAKMRYKCDYKPQYVLDLETWSWNLLDEEMKRLMSEKKYVSMSKEREEKDQKPTADAGKIDDVESAAAQTDQEDADMTDLDREADFDLPDPLDASEAYRGGLSLFALNVPGVMTTAEVLDQVNLDEIMVFLRSGMLARTAVSASYCVTMNFSTQMDLVSWSLGSVVDTRSVKGAVAELVACVGPKVGGEMIVFLQS